MILGVEVGLSERLQEGFDFGRGADGGRGRVGQDAADEAGKNLAGAELDEAG